MANLAKIEKYLHKLKLSYKVIDLGEEVFTVKGVADSGVDNEEIVKTLIIRFEPNSSPGLERGYAAFAIRGKDRVDFRKVRKLFGPSTSLRPSALRSSTVRLRPNRLRLEEVNCELASSEEVLKVCGVPVGAVCPVLLDIPVYFDRNVMELSHVNMGSGDLTKGLEMDLSDLLTAVGSYQVDDLV